MGIAADGRVERVSAEEAPLRLGLGLDLAADAADLRRRRRTGTRWRTGRRAGATGPGRAPRPPGGGHGTGGRPPGGPSGRG